MLTTASVGCKSLRSALALCHATHASARIVSESRRRLIRPGMMAAAGPASRLEFCVCNAAVAYECAVDETDHSMRRHANDEVMGRDVAVPSKAGDGVWTLAVQAAARDMPHPCESRSTLLAAKRRSALFLNALAHPPHRLQAPTRALLTFLQFGWQLAISMNRHHSFAAVLTRWEPAPRVR